MTANPTQAEIRVHNGRPTVFINGQPHALAGFCPINRQPCFDNAMPCFYAHRMGVYILEGNAWRFWVGDTVLEMPRADSANPMIDEVAAAVLANDPDAWLMIRFTPHAPESWLDLHGNELFVTDEGKSFRWPSLASDAYWGLVNRVSAALVRYCEARPWSERVIGYANFTVCEGTHPPVCEGWMFDHGETMRTRWRSFLKARYPDERELRAACGDSTATHDTVEVPSDRLRGPQPEVTADLYWQDGASNRPLRDYLELQRDLWHQRFTELCAAMAGAVNRKVIMLYDCHKQTQPGWNLNGFFKTSASWSPAYPEVLAGSGHMNVAELLDIPGCDGLITPLDYQARGIAGVTEAEGISDSVALRGQFYYGEMDQATMPVGEKEFSTPRTDAEFAAITWRGLATAWTRGWDVYWFDIGGGYYDTPGRHEIIGRQVAAMKASVDWPHETLPGIAMILDDTSVLETNGAGNYLNEAVMWQIRMGLARCGVPYRVYLLDDLALGNFPRHRVYYFPNLFRVDEARLALLRDKVLRDGNVVVWGPGSGITDGTRLGADLAERLTGFRFRLEPVNTVRRIALTNFDHPITRDVPPDTILGGPLPYGPVLFPKDGTELGMSWTKWQCNEMGLAVKAFGRGAGGHLAGAGNYAAVFTTAVPLPASLWRGIARYAGAHVYCDDNEVVLADSSIVAMHSMKSGPKRLRLPGRHTVYDVVNGGELARGVDEIAFDLHAPETRVFRLA
jgi:hypothetical protein